MNNCLDININDVIACSGCYRAIKECCCIFSYIRELEKQVSSLTEMYKEISISYAKITDLEIGKLQAKPHKCPVCDGFCKYQSGMLHLVTGDYGRLDFTCRACEGKGIVWK